MRPVKTIAAAAVLVGLAAFPSRGQNVAKPAVRAFVPNLTPRTRVRPAYPGDAFRLNIAGTVSVIAAIDQQGNVIDATAIAGPDPLRRAAVEAVKKETFRPVLREGKPVIAATDTSISFTIAGVPSPAPDQQDFDAAIGLIRQLQSRYPRTPAQVLEDDEQQWAELTGLDRIARLPQLAGAALNADNAGKAAQYGNELVTAGTEHRADPRYGWVINAGDTVLGELAVRGRDLAAAERYLLASADFVDSPLFHPIGPSMMLAKSLLEANRPDAVLRYFDRLKQAWARGERTLDQWSTLVRTGQTPNFGANARLF